MGSGRSIGWANTAGCASPQRHCAGSLPKRAVRSATASVSAACSMRGAVAAAPMRAGGRQHVGDEFRQRAAVVHGDAGLLQHAAVEVVRPGVEDQRLRRVAGHAAVPVAQQRLGAAGGVLGDRHGEQRRQDLVGEGRMHIDLHAGEVGRGVAIRPAEQLADAARRASRRTSRGRGTPGNRAVRCDRWR